MKTDKRWFTAIGLAALCSIWLAAPGRAQNSPHAVWGRVLNAAGQPPRAEQFRFTAYIAQRPTEILTQNSFGCGYHEPDGTWWLNTGNFQTEWQIGDTLVVELLLVAGPDHTERAILRGALTGAGNDRFPDAALEIVRQTPDSPTPVELISFSADRQDDGSVELIWKTASEAANVGFRIERALEKNAVFSAIGFVEGYGSSSRPQEYRFVDHPPAGAVRYRIVQIDADGRENLFPEVEVVADLPADFVLLQNFPNPVRAMNGGTEFRFTLPRAGDATITIYDLRGRRVARLQAQGLSSGRHGLRWNGLDSRGRRLPSGIYFYELRFEELRLRNSLIFMR